MKPTLPSLAAAALSGTIAFGAVFGAIACTRTLYVGADGMVITGRNMDWREDLGSDIWLFPQGVERDGSAGDRSLRWTSRYGSVVVSAYDAGSADGMNEKGLVANLLYLAEADFGSMEQTTRPLLSVAGWPQYVLDNYATVAEAVEGLRKEPFTLFAPSLPNGAKSTLHLSISDPSGDSAIFEYLGGKLVVHHGPEYTVMTNSPSYDQQLALNAYWKSIGGEVFLPGTSRASDRFARAWFLLDAIPKQLDENYIKSVPQRSYAFQAVAAVMSVQRSVSVPLGISAPSEPNIAATIWRTVADQKNRVYYFDSATRPNTFWVSLDKVDLSAGTPVRRLTIQNGEVFAGEVADRFEPAEPYAFLSMTH